MESKNIIAINVNTITLYSVQKCPCTCSDVIKGAVPQHKMLIDV